MTHALANLCRLVCGRHRIFLVVFVSLLFAPDSPQAQASDQATLLLAENGKASAGIVISSNDSPLIQQSAQDLSHYLQKMTGGEFPIHVGSQSHAHAIRLTLDDQLPATMKPRLSTKGPEAYLITVEGSTLWLAGRTPLAVQHSVAHLLHDLGCRWFMPHPAWHVIPRKPTLIVGTDTVHEPAFVHRSLESAGVFSGRVFSEYYQRWQRLNRMVSASPLLTQHAYSQLLPSSKWFERHPEYFALVDGRRSPAQPCLTHPDARRLMLENMKSYLDARPSLTMVSVEPNDNTHHCQCERCQRAGSVGERVFAFANEAAAALERSHAGKRVGLLAYLDHAEPPPFPLATNVYVGITTNLRSTPLSVEDSIDRFRALGATVGIYDYLNVYQWHWDLPANARGTRGREIADYVRRLHDRHGVRSYMAECSTSWGSTGPTYWMLSRMLWNPSEDPNLLLNEFFQGAFGKAADPIRRLYERWGRGEGRSYPRHDLCGAFDELHQAMALEADPEVAARLEHVAMYLHSVALWWEYDRIQKSTEPGPSRDQALKRSAGALMVHAVRVTDLGLINTHQILNPAFLAQRFTALAKVFSTTSTSGPSVESNDWAGLSSFSQMVQQARTSGLDASGQPRPYPTAEIQKMIDAHRRELSDAVAFAEWHVPRALIAMEVDRSATLRIWPSPKRPMFPARARFLFHARAGENLVLLIGSPTRQQQPRRMNWTIHRADGDQEVSRGTLENMFGDDRVRARIDFTAEISGVHYLQGREDWQDFSFVECHDRPVVVWAGHQQTHLQPAFLGLYPDPVYFHVPAGTRRFAVGVPLVRRAIRVKITSPDGRIQLETLLNNGEQKVVEVPAGQDHAIWQIKPSDNRWFLELFGVPPYLSHDPTKLVLEER